MTLVSALSTHCKGRAPEAHAPACDKPGVSTSWHSYRRLPRSFKAAQVMSPSAPLGSNVGDVTAQRGHRSLLDCHPEPKGPARSVNVGGASWASAKHSPALRGRHPRGLKWGRIG